MGQEKTVIQISKERLKEHLKQWLATPDHTGKPNIELVYDQQLIKELEEYGSIKEAIDPANKEIL